MDSIKGGTMDQVPRKSIKLKDGKGQKERYLDSFACSMS
jgi:hypothetical protein